MTPVLQEFARWLASDGLAPLAVNALLKVTALLAIVWLASPLLRRSSAATRHLVWTVALTGCLALPLLLPIMPVVSIPVLPGVTPTSAPDSPPAGLASTPSLERHASRPSNAPPRPESNAFVMPSTTALFTAIWAIVAAALLVRLVRGTLRVRRLALRAADDESWLPTARAIVEQTGMTTPVRFVEGRPDAMPMTWGVRRPVVLLPEGAAAWPASRLRAVLVHELAHVKRRDCLTQTMAGAVCALYWFNPLAWLAAARLVSERERACDDEVLAAGADGGDYAEQLLDVAKSMRPHGVIAWATVSMARRSQLEGRLLAILDPDVPRRAPSRALSALLIVGLIVCVPMLAALEAGYRTAAPEAAITASPAMVLPGTDAPGRLLVEALDEAVGGQTPRPAPMPRPTPTPTPNPTPTPVVAGGRTSREVGDGAKRAPLDQKVIDALAAALKDTDAEVREQAAAALGQTRDARTLEPLLAAIADGNPDVREQVVFALAQLRDKRATPKLVGALADIDADVREQAAFALSQVRDPASAPALAGLLNDKDPQVRERVVFALGQIRDPKAVDGLIAALNDPSVQVQEQAAFALSQIRDPRAVTALIGMLTSSAANVREQAAFALGQIRDSRATDALLAAMKDADAEVRKAAAFALSQVVGRQQ